MLWTLHCPIYALAQYTLTYASLYQNDCVLSLVASVRDNLQFLAWPGLSYSCFITGKPNPFPALVRLLGELLVNRGGSRAD